MTNLDKLVWGRGTQIGIAVQNMETHLHIVTRKVCIIIRYTTTNKQNKVNNKVSNIVGDVCMY